MTRRWLALLDAKNRLPTAKLSLFASQEAVTNLESHFIVVFGCQWSVLEVETPKFANLPPISSIFTSPNVYDECC